ncbi:hypothetical protein [Pandoraea sp. PE-S2T-3]|uniref:hypothetical protein n=1 Tax=Pandoraea sp. PE-S2T-3 TaxID=1986993 RepID=UPI00112508FC|nr:hypothetical protein [Pandoraea sp. PE-S2T-3]
MTNGIAIIRVTAARRYPELKSFYPAKNNELRRFLPFCVGLRRHSPTQCVKTTRRLCAKAKQTIAEYNREFAALIT